MRDFEAAYSRMRKAVVVRNGAVYLFEWGHLAATGALVQGSNGYWSAAMRAAPTPMPCTCPAVGRDHWSDECEGLEAPP